MMRKALNISCHFLASLGLLLTIYTPLPTEAANASQWRAGRIMDDAIFTDFDSMSISSVQNFLESKDSVCLVDFKSPNPLGNNQYGSDVSAAHVIWKSGQLFDINPKVLLVTLQKEQGLITAESGCSGKRRTAMGFACPDDGSCDPNYFGFSKQMYQGARHFRGFFNNDEDWFVPFTTGIHRIDYHPNDGCGGTNVNILTRATASLYSYTPYQPNQAALNNLYGAATGSGSECASYGNRNFWRDFTDWFGPTLVPSYKARLYGRSNLFELKPGLKQQVFIAYRNIGSATWCDNVDTSGLCPEGALPTVLAGGNPTYRISRFNGLFDRVDRPKIVFSQVLQRNGTPYASDSCCAHRVKPNQIAKFVFDMVAPMTLRGSSIAEEWFKILKMPSTTMGDDGKALLQVKIPQLDRGATSSGTSGLRGARPGRQLSTFVKIKNTGNIVWYDKTTTQVTDWGVEYLTLSTAKPTGRSSIFGANYEIPRSRTTSVLDEVQESNGSLADNQHTVRPGETAVFRFTMTVPNRDPGIYTEWVGLRFAGAPGLVFGPDIPIKIKILQAD